MVDVYNEEYTEIECDEQFRKICNSQDATELSSIRQVQEIVKKFQNEGETYTIFSIRDESDSCWYITYGIGWGNCIGYYVLKGNFTLLNEIEL